MTDHILPRVKMELGGGGGHVPEVSLCLEWPNGMPHFRCELTAGLHDNYTRATRMSSHPPHHSFHV